MVSVLGVKFNPGGWPSNIPFTDLNRIPGGTRPLKVLQDLVDKGNLKLVWATLQDRQDAERDPRSVIPNTVGHDAALAVPGAPPSKKLVHRITDFASQFQLPPPAHRPLPTGTVYHPMTISPRFSFSTLPTTTADAPNASTVSDRPRRRRAQRSDINKGRLRPVTNPEGRKLRHPKRGPTTAKYIVESPGIKPDEVGKAIKGGGIVLTNENLSDCFELARGEAGGSGDREMGVEGELSSDIESASEWDREMMV